MSLLIIITLTLSTQSLVAKDVKASYSRKINLTSQKIYKVENEVINIIKWKYHSGFDVVLLYMTDDDMYWFNSYLESIVWTFSERVEMRQDQFLSEKNTEGSGFKDLSSYQREYYVVIASFGTGELEYDLIYYSYYFDYQEVLNVLTIIIVMCGSLYVLIEIGMLKTEKKPNEHKKIHVINPTYKIPSNPTFRYCDKCGTKLDDDAVFCHNCGKKFK
jgi:hypothetical protein